MIKKKKYKYKDFELEHGYGMKDKLIDYLNNGWLIYKELTISETSDHYRNTIIILKKQIL